MEKIKTITKKEFLKRTGAKSCQTLADVFGFDFMQSCTIAEGKGPYTLKQIKDALQLNNNTLTVILNKRANTYNDRPEYRGVRVANDFSGFDIDFKFYRAEEKRRNRDFKEYYRKRDFEDERKEWGVFYVISQDRTAIRQTRPTWNIKPNQTPFDRYKVLNKTVVYFCKDWHGPSWVRRFDYLDNANGTRRSISPCTFTDPKIKEGERQPLGDVVDASGYILTNYHHALKERADRYKMQKRKQEAENLDTTKQINELKKQFEALKSELCDKIKNAQTAEQMEKVQNIIRHLYNFIYYIEWHKKRNFNTAENKANDVKTLQQRAEEIADKLKGAKC